MKSLHIYLWATYRGPISYNEIGSRVNKQLNGMRVPEALWRTNIDLQ